MELTVWEMLKLSMAVNNSPAEGTAGLQKTLHRLSDLLEMSEDEKAAVGLREVRYLGGGAGYDWRPDAAPLTREMSDRQREVARAVVMAPPSGVFQVRDGRARRALLEKLGASTEELEAIFGGDE